MADLVVTVPRDFWVDWIGEGDAVGEPETGEEWGFFLGGSKPPIVPGERLYVVAHGLLRGYAPVTGVERGKVGGWGIGRKGGAVAVTIPEDIKGFRGWRRRWWDRADERPFPIWEFARVPPNMALRIFGRHWFERDAMPEGFYGDVMRFVSEWVPARTDVTVISLVDPLAERFGLERPDAETLASWAGWLWLRWKGATPQEVSDAHLWAWTVHEREKAEKKAARKRTKPPASVGQADLFNGGRRG